ncbi:MAG: hypothetical protein ACI9FB_003828 [Candidatus Azotimanducaceae bacterium]|jgi:hypothetical protein
MNTNTYVGYFAEISKLKKTEQEGILEKARYLTFTKHGLSGRYTIYLASSFLFIFMIGIISGFVIGFSILTTGLSIGAGSIASYYLFRYFSGELLKVGLLDLLSETVEEG